MVQQEQGFLLFAQKNRISNAKRSYSCVFIHYGTLRKRGQILRDNKIYRKEQDHSVSIHEEKRFFEVPGRKQMVQEQG